MAAHLAGVNVSELHPFLQLRLAHGQEFARTLHIHVAREVVYARELMLDGVAHGADQDFVWHFETQHNRARWSSWRDVPLLRSIVTAAVL